MYTTQNSSMQTRVIYKDVTRSVYSILAVRTKLQGKHDEINGMKPHNSAQSSSDAQDDRHLENSAQLIFKYSTYNSTVRHLNYKVR